MKALFDTNLEFPQHDLCWAKFFAAETCDIASTADLDVLTQTLLQHRADFSYLPSANCFFLRGDSAYRGLASALTGRSRMPLQNSVLVVRSADAARRWQDLRSARLGYLNSYCTTSYFAPAILLARGGQSLTSFFRAMPVAAWQGQIDAVIDGSVDATMVYEDVWLARGENAVRTKVIARIDDIPTPAMFVRSGLDAFASRLKAALLGFAPPAAPAQLYSGFVDYQAAPMQRFFAELDALPMLQPSCAGSAVVHA
jgi:phosphonate transport system substrate-binding protein